jgi:2-methylisocitrate lyase-like PEP mutase family enzyme
MITTDRAARFHELHAAGCFVMPNPFDAGSARVLEQLGFQAVATTSCGFAWSIARADNHVQLEEALAHLRAVSSAVTVPVNADFEGGFAVEPDDVYRNVRLATETGVAGLSIEDSSGDSDAPLFDFELAVERIRAARRAIDDSGTRVVLTGRSEGFLVGRPDLGETIRRLNAYAEAGADCLYAPRISTKEQITAIVSEIAPKPVNVLVGANYITVAELADLGVRRISVGGALARAAWQGFVRAASEIARQGTFENLDHAIPFDDINQRFMQ